MESCYSDTVIAAARAFEGSMLQASLLQGPGELVELLRELEAKVSAAAAAVLSDNQKRSAAVARAARGGTYAFSDEVLMEQMAVLDCVFADDAGVRRAVVAVAARAGIAVRVSRLETFFGLAKAIETRDWKAGAALVKMIAAVASSPEVFGRAR